MFVSLDLRDIIHFYRYFLLYSALRLKVRYTVHCHSKMSLAARFSMESYIFTHTLSILFFLSPSNFQNSLPQQTSYHHSNIQTAEHSRLAHVDSLFVLTFRYLSTRRSDASKTCLCHTHSVSETLLTPACCWDGTSASHFHESPSFLTSPLSYLYFFSPLK